MAREFTHRNQFVAGWTGPAQVEKGVTKPAGYAVLDVAIEHCRTSSGWTVVRTDLAILRRTVVVMVKGEGLQF